MSNIRLVGILNITPDSFSDGGRFLDVESALQQASQMISEGAALIDVGADSTRPGSECVGAVKEIERLAPLLKALNEQFPFSIDTHHAQVAQFAIQHGAQMVNDVSAGFDPEMFSVVARSDVRYVMMYSRCRPPHQFMAEPSGSILDSIRAFFDERIESALRGGISESQIVLDPGMGKFISDDPECSWKVIRHFSELSDLGFPLYLGASRKGFLKLPLEENLYERDWLTAFVGRMVAGSLPEDYELYVRVHSVSTQQLILPK